MAEKLMWSVPNQSQVVKREKITAAIIVLIVVLIQETQIIPTEIGKVDAVGRVTILKSITVTNHTIKIRKDEEIVLVAGPCNELVFCKCPAFGFSRRWRSNLPFWLLNAQHRSL